MEKLCTVCRSIVLLWVGILASWSDMRKNIIPNRLVFCGMGIGMMFRIAVDIFYKTSSDILVMVLEVILLFFCVWPVYRTGGLGAGDCKLLLLTGVCLPVKHAISVIIGTFFIAAAEIMLLWIIRKIRKEKKKMTAIHFAPSYLLAVLICLGR